MKNHDCSRVSVCSTKFARSSNAIGGVKLVSLVLLSTIAVAHAQFVFVTNNGAITITQYTGPGGAVVIPAETNGYPVTAIAGGAKTSAFGSSGITAVTIPDSITNIGAFAFQSCTNLTSISVPDGVRYVGDQAFVHCTSLTNATLGSNTTSIGISVFGSCNNLPAVNVNELNPNYSSIAGVLCNKSQTVLIEFPPGKRGVYAVPNGVTTIGTSAFATCTSLTGVIITNGVTAISNNAFSGCVNLASADLPGSLSSIGQYAFSSCSGLPLITIPNGVTAIADFTFAYCSQLAHVALGGGITSIGRAAFVDCTSLTNITIPSRVTTIGVDAFSSCGLVSVVIPDGVTSIGDDAFGGCVNLTSVSLPNSITSIGYMVFNFCNSLANITIPGSVTFIEQSAFRYCTDLHGVYFEGNAPAVSPFDVFNSVNNVTSYYLPGTSGWGSTLSGHPTALWNPMIQSRDSSFGPGANGFGFNITGTANIPVVLEACTNLAGSVWTTVRSCNVTNGSINFSDPGWTNFPARFYRIRSP